MLDSFVQFLSIHAPLKKKGSLHRLIEEVLENYQVQLDEKRITLSKKYEADLPETIVPDRPLSYILDSVLRYGISAVASEGFMELSTKSFKLKKGVMTRKRSDDRQYARVQLLFKMSQDQRESFQESLSLALLGLTRELVRENQGIMKIEKDEKQGTQSVSMWFPSERRETLRYRKINLLK